MQLAESHQHPPQVLLPANGVVDGVLPPASTLSEPLFLAVVLAEIVVVAAVLSPVELCPCRLVTVGCAVVSPINSRSFNAIFNREQEKQNCPPDLKNDFGLQKRGYAWHLQNIAAGVD